MHEKERIVVICGAFDPLSIEELNYIKKCHRRGDHLIVGVHTEWWMMWALGGFVQTYETRREIIKSLK